MSYKFNPFSGNFDIVGSASGGTGDPGGSTTQVQFNDAGVFGGDSTFTFNKTTDTLTVANLATTGTITGGTGVIAIGTNQIYKDASGNVGIGTSSPASKLSFGANIGFDFAVYEGPGGSNKYGIGVSGTGTGGDPYRLKFYANGSERAYIDSDGTFVLRQASNSANTSVSFNTTKQNALTLDSSGHLGLGNAATAGWGAVSYSVYQARNVSFAGLGADLHATSNAYYDGANWRYIAGSVVATNYYQNAGAHAWRTTGATTGTAGGTLSWTTAMTLDASGWLSVGAIPSEQGKFSVQGSVANESTALSTVDAATVTIRNQQNTAFNQKAKLVLAASIDSKAVIAGYYENYNGVGSTGSGLLFATQYNAAGGVVERLRIDSSGNVLVKSAAGLGYGTGAGGAVTQGSGSGKSTAVTLNKPCGQITMNNAALAAGASVDFLLNNTLIAGEDVLSCNVAGYSDYTAICRYCTSGSAMIRVTNVSAGSLSQPVLVNFAIIKGATS